MNRGLLEAMEVLEREKNIAKDTPIETIGNSLSTAHKGHFGKADNIKVTVDPSACDFAVYTEKTIVGNMEDDILGVSLADAKAPDPEYEVGDTAQIPLNSKKFGRIATQSARNITLQKIREEECKILYSEYYTRKKDVMADIVQRYLGRNVSINPGKVDTVLNESEQIEGETFRPTEHIKVYVIEVEDILEGPRVSVSRTHPDLVKRLFESEVTEARDGTMEIKTIARGAGSRTRIAVKSNDSNMDPVGTCVGLNSARVNFVVSELHGEKIGIINWDDNPAYLIESALSPVRVVRVVADEEARGAQAIVPGYQLSLAIGKGGQNARLAARLISFKVDIKSETQTREMGLFEQMNLQYGDTPATSFEKETREESENYREYQENYQEDVNEQE